MARQIFMFDKPSRFIAGTVGEPGDRTFFLQATDGTLALLGYGMCVGCHRAEVVG